MKRTITIKVNEELAREYKRLHDNLIHDKSKKKLTDAQFFRGFVEDMIVDEIEFLKEKE